MSVRNHTQAAILAASLLMHCPLASAQQWFDNDKPAPDDGSHAIVGGFGAFLLLVPYKPIYLLEDFDSVRDKRAPRTPTVDTVRTGDSFGAVLFLGGCSRDRFKRCCTSTDFLLYQPSGELYWQKLGITGCTSIAPPDGKTYVSDAHADFAMPRRAPRGVYRLVARVRDLRKNIELTVETTFTLQ